MDDTEDPAFVGFTGSLNEPKPPEAPPEEETDELPSDGELMAMTRAQIDALAAEYEVDTKACSSKAEAISMLRDELEV